MKLKNKIFNYFATFSSVKGQPPQVFSSPVTMPSSVARQKLEEQFKDANLPPLPVGPILHVCFDYDSEIIYTINSEDFSKDRADFLLQAVKLRILKDFGNFSSRTPINGSPFSSVRVRSLESFGHARKIISDHYKGKVFKNLPVIEAFLDRMPTTRSKLPERFRAHREFLGDYIGPEEAQSVTFIDEIDVHNKKRAEPKIVLTQATPFILIDISMNRQKGKEREETTATEKEWVVLNAYRKYLSDTEVSKEEKYITEDINNFADLFAIKRKLYLGWPFEEVSSFFMESKMVNNFGSLMVGIERLMTASNSLEAEGYKNPASYPYYITFKIDKTFPLFNDFSSMVDPNTGNFDRSRQPEPANFAIIDYDEDNQHILIETPVFLSPRICTNILKAKSPPFICRYNYVVNKIDIKTDDNSVKEIDKNKIQKAKIAGMIKYSLPEEKKKTIDFRSGALASGRSSVDPNIWTIRKMSDYLYATDFIKKMCEKNNLPFVDLDVVIGPIAQKFGQGVQGGFMDANSLLDAKPPIKTPYELEKGVWITPPLILVNSQTQPSHAKQAETLIHEYRHFLYSIQRPDYKNTYGHLKHKKDDKDYEYWYTYLTDPNEREAHREEIKFELGLGKSYDEIIRDKVGGAINTNNYPIAIKFSELVQEALKELEEETEKNEKPTGQPE